LSKKSVDHVLHHFAQLTGAWYWYYEDVELVPTYCVWYNTTALSEILAIQSRGIQTFLSEGHISFYTRVRRPGIIRTVVWLFRSCLPNQQVLRKYIIFSLRTKQPQ